MNPLFDPGRLVITKGALDVLDPFSVTAAVMRHVNGDWGDLCEEDRQSNEHALSAGNRLLSVYTDDDKTAFWIITEADRSTTTILLPEDY